MLHMALTSPYDSIWHCISVAVPLEGRISGLSISSFRASPALLRQSMRLPWVEGCHLWLALHSVSWWSEVFPPTAQFIDSFLDHCASRGGEALGLPALTGLTASKEITDSINI